MTAIRSALVLAFVGLSACSAFAQGSAKPAPAPRARPAARPSTPLPRGYVLLGAGYALGKVTDLYLDANYYRADNYTDNPAVTLSK